MFRQKALAELGCGCEDGSPRWARWSGEPSARVAVFESVPADDFEGGETVSAGDVAEALDKALTALGYDAEDTFRLHLLTEKGEAAAEAVVCIRWQIEAVDPSVVIALDSVSASVVAEALRLSRLTPGKVAHRDGRSVVAVDGFAASLSDPARKRLVWQQLKSVSADTLSRAFSSR